MALTLHRELRERPHLVAMVHERGLTERTFLPAQRGLAHEVHAAGLRAARAAAVVRAVPFLVVGHVLVERDRERPPVQSPALWDAENTADPSLARAPVRPADGDRLLTTSVRALADGLLGSSCRDAPPHHRIDAR
ncbi:hypothetical protein ACF05T_00210 [Streptomyces lateritius]|uniref:Uncharacterized protein n=1 Tax=Streptomyces lateritius TaxID=67313 RepID=A0ABW6Y446_9ACTN